MINKIKVMVFMAAAILISSFMTNTAKAAQDNDNANDLFRSGKEILYFLMCTEDSNDTEDMLRKEYNVSDVQIDALRELALRQHNNCKTAKSLWADSVDDYNNAVKNEACIIDDNMKKILGNNYANVKQYLENSWLDKKSYSGISAYSDKNVIVVWATQYNANREFEVSLPDQRLKMSYPNYTLSIVSYDKGTSVDNVPVGDAGPWNINDNYWDNNRRIFSDLELGRPEAAAAYFDNYNDGCDEYGRVVSNPAGIDLSREVANMLGFGSMESGWVSIYLNF